MPPTGSQQLADWFGAQPAQQAVGQAGTFLVPKPMINPIQVPPKRPPIDVLSQPGALAQARPPVMIGAPGPKPQITIQGPQTGPTPTQDTLLKSARGRELQVTGGMDLGPVTSAAPGSPMLPPPVIGPGASGGAGMSQAARDRLAEVRALQQEALLSPVAMSGTMATTRTFHPVDPSDLSRGGTLSEETMDYSPEAIARRRAGQLVPTAEQYAQADQASQQSLQQLLAQQAGTRDWQEKNRRFALDETTLLGRLQMENAKHVADLAAQMQALTPAGRKQLFINSQLAANKSPEETYALAEQAERLGQFGAAPAPSPLGTPPSVGGLGGGGPTPAPGPGPDAGPVTVLSRLAPEETAYLQANFKGKPREAFQHLLDTKGKEWVSHHRDAVKNYLAHLSGGKLDDLRDQVHAGFWSHLFTDPVDFLSALAPMEEGPWQVGTFWSPSGREAYSRNKQMPAAERLYRFFGWTPQQNEGSALLRALLP